MTRRERVMTAISHKEADRVPKGEIWVGGNLANKLLGADYPHDYQHPQRDLEVRNLLHMDLINLGDWPFEEIGTDACGSRRFRSVYGYEYVFNGLTKHIVKPPLDDIADADLYPVPDINRVSGEIIAEFSRNTDLFVLGQIGGPVSMLDEMFPMEDFMVYCLTNTREMRNLGEKVMEFEIAKAKRFIDSGADGILFADDIAFNTGAFLPPHIMEELVYPFYVHAIKEIKRYKQVPVIFHSDGDLSKVLDRIAEAGFDGIQSLQPSAGMDIARIKKDYGDIQSLQPSAGMDIARIKKDYGDALCLMGNIDLDHVMTFGTPKEVEEAVKRVIDIAAPGGGFILSTCNTLIDAISPENALAMYRTADTYGIYNKGAGQGTDDWTGGRCDV